MKQKFLSVFLFSHSAKLHGTEGSLLELTSELVKDDGVVCFVILTNDGPIKVRALTVADKVHQFLFRREN